MSIIKMLFGTLARKPHTYKHVSLDKIVGKTIRAIGESEVFGSNGKESHMVLFFTDGTRHAFVLPDEY